MNTAAAATDAWSPALVPDDPFALVPGDAVLAVAMSGGVDSSVAAAMSATSGRRSFGITLAMWPRDASRDRDRGCCSIDAVEDARRVAATVGIPHYAWDLEADFATMVIEPYAEEYARGRTPNPCVQCNARVKFGTLLERARASGATHLVTGHWARTGRRGELPTLHRARHSARDQAYTLHRLNGAQLGAAVFPLGSIATKEQVRATAESLGLITAQKAESQDLCFVESTVTIDLEQRLSGRFRPGEILDRDGSVVGEHRGLPFYTVGQRSGLGLRAQQPDMEPQYVVAVDADTNSITVGPRRLLERTMLTLEDCRWTTTAPRRGEAPVDVQIRAHGAATAATVVSADGQRLQLRCDPPVTQPAPGQSAVLYRGDEVLGGGVIR